MPKPVYMEVPTPSLRFKVGPLYMLMAILRLKARLPSPIMASFILTVVVQQQQILPITCLLFIRMAWARFSSQVQEVLKPSGGLFFITCRSIMFQVLACLPAKQLVIILCSRTVHLHGV